MIEAIVTQLAGMSHIVTGLDNEAYKQKLAVLSGSSIGQHVRHIIEFYTCIVNSKEEVICYDDRSRDIRLESDKMFALDLLKSLQETFRQPIMDAPIRLRSNMSFENCESQYLHSSRYRELVYAFEHGVHHQAIIKIALHELGKTYLIDTNFGVAPSTIRYQKQLQ